MTYGHFDDGRREYVITNPRTPVKWINYVGTLDFGGFVDHTGGLLLCRQDPARNRITRYSAIHPASDFKGSTLYLRLREPRGHRIVAPFFVPTLNALTRYECRIGIGYTRIVTEIAGLRSEVTLFVPPGEHRLIEDIRLTNIGRRELGLDVIPVVEYSHFDALKQLTNADWVPQTMQSRAYKRAGRRLVLTQYAFMNRDQRVNFLTCSEPVSSFESDRAHFLGDHEYGSWARPLALERAELGCNQANRGDNIGALLHRIQRLKPRETRRLIVQLGQCGTLDDEWRSIERFWQAEEVDRAFASLGRFWDDYLAKLQAKTPDSALNRMLNIHNPRQCYVTMQWSRYLSLYQLGYGARGIGVRDASQDVLSVLPAAGAEARALIVRLLGVQRRDGSAMHQFNPLTLEASRGDAAERDDRPQYYSDDHLWTVLTVTQYLKETGNLAFLEEELPFYDKDRAGRPLERATVLEHLRRAIAFTSRNMGQHGLPLLGFADWNDTVNLPAGAESFFTANLYGKALRELAGLCCFVGDPSADTLEREYEAMRACVNEHGWDGEWYLRYFDHDGTPLGSRRNDVGQIYVNGQSWPVISGFAPPERARQALDAVYQRLNTRNGIKLSTPGFNGYDPTKGGVTTYPPGAKENCGIFLHANPWAIIAETILGNGDRAYEYYRQINPAAKNSRIDEYQCEPYVYAQNILGDEHPQFGLARNSWLTGTASWMYVAGTQHILGIQPTYTGLIIDPCIPAAWKGFSVTRHFRGAVYHITVKNPQHVCRGVRSLTVDGRPVIDNAVPVFGDGSHRVEAVLG